MRKEGIGRRKEGRGRRYEEWKMCSV